MQADPHIQAPMNSQSYNRYSYVLNNPLSMTDPSGFFFKKLLQAIAKIPILNAAIHVVLNLIPGCQYWCSAVFSAATTYAVTGSLKAAFTSAVVSLASPGGGSYGAIAATAVIGGLASKAQSGNFGHGFWSAGLGAALGGRIKTGNAYANVAVAALIGGTISKATGGKFSNGAQTWAFSAAMAQDWGSRRLADSEENTFDEKNRRGLDSAIDKLNGEIKEQNFGTEDEAAVWLGKRAASLQADYGAEVGARIFEAYDTNLGRLSIKAGNIVTDYHSGSVSASTLSLSKVNFSMRVMGAWHTHPLGSAGFSGGNGDVSYYKNKPVYVSYGGATYRFNAASAGAHPGYSGYLERNWIQKNTTCLAGC